MPAARWTKSCNSPGMPVTIHRIPRADLPENGVVVFEADGARYVVADLDGDVRAFAVAGPAARDLDRTVIAENRVRCPAHGWAIDAMGQCGAGGRCRYEPVPVMIQGDDIRVVLAAG